MTVDYHLQDRDFEWDARKADSNFVKHGVTFEEAAEAFLDPFCLTVDASVEAEQREAMIGYSFARRLLLVVHVERTAVTRIISRDWQPVPRGSCMSEPDEIRVLRVHPRPSEDVTLSIPKDVLRQIREVAETRDMSAEALMKFYIGHELRQDLARLYSERIIQTTERVLARHISSEDERSAILREIRGEAAA